ncbi:Uncharacterised protein [Mycobacterium tuberculosis]|nr:Uncharacterised protein [Mycobacterium tuberculosis]CNV74980.1 Uncharacterised protein [Mycobacterium tuberculosis]
MSRLVMMPTSAPSSSTTGNPEIRNRAHSASTWAKVLSGRQVTGSVTMPASDRFTISTWPACSATGRLRCNTPMPPARAIAMAIRDSVTVSIAELTSGTLSLIFLVSWLEVSAVAGTTSEAAGNNKTSSNVSPSIATLCGSSPPVGTGSVVRPPMRTYGLTTRSELSSRPDMPRDIGGALHTHVFSEKPILSARNRPVTMRAAALAEKNRTITPRRGCASVWSARHEARTQFLALSPRACVV